MNTPVHSESAGPSTKLGPGGTYHLADMPAIPNLRPPLGVQTVLVGPYLPPGHDKGERMQKAQDQEQVGEPLMKHL